MRPPSTLSHSSVPQSQPRIVKADLLQRDIRALFDRYLSHFDTTEEMIQDAEMNLAESQTDLDDALSARLVEGTFHPSQIHSPVLLRAVWEELKRLRVLHRQRRSSLQYQPWSAAERQQLVEQAVTTVFQHARQYEDVLSDAAVPSHSRFKHREVRMLKRYIRQHALQAGASPEAFLDVLYDMVNVTRFDPLQDPWADYKVDESWETVARAKTHLLSGLSSIDVVWVDFDGAKRPEGIMFSKYGSLLVEDIRRSVRRLGPQSEADHDMIRSSGWSFLKTDVLIHVLTQVLKDNSLPTDEKIALESVMDLLKRNRLRSLRRLQELRDRILKRLEERNIPVLSLSERIRFAIRLDHKHIEALMAELETGELPTDHPLCPHAATFYRIAQQIAEVSSLDDRLLPQVMIANAEGLEDFRALCQYFGQLRLTGDAEHGVPQLHHPVKIVPLFESQQTVEETGAFLDQAWELFEGNAEAFSSWCNEIFFAGSDLSKQVGQFSALLGVWQAALSIEAFNRRHGLDIRVKLGSGETPFRQLGYLDPDAFLPLFEDQSSIVDLVGEDMIEIDPSGMHWLLRRFPWINSFTQQSRSREQASLALDPPRLQRIFAEMRAFHSMRYSLNPSMRSECVIPPALRKAAEIEQEAYQSFMGDPDSDEYKPGQSLLSAPALYEYFSRLKPVIRDRGVSRQSVQRNLLDDVDHRRKAGIDARAIATNTASRFLFPLVLLGKGSVLDQFQQKPKYMETFLDYLPLRDVLQLFLQYRIIAPRVFQLLYEEGFQTLSDAFQSEFSSFERSLPLLRESLIRRMLPAHVVKALPTWSDRDFQRFYEALPDDYRFLFDDHFLSPKARLYAQAFSDVEDHIRRGLQYLALCQNFSEAFDEALSSFNAEEVSDDGLLRQELFHELHSRHALCSMEDSKYLRTIPQTLRLRITALLDHPLLQEGQGMADEDWNGFLSRMAYALGALG